jgi:putative flippase GtrA
MKLRLGQLLRYAGTAGVAAVVDIGGFALLMQAGVPLPVAAAMSFLAATVVNYLLTARLVFHAPASLRGYGRFLLAASIGFLLNVGTTTLAAHAFGAPAITAKIIGVGLAFFANFALNAGFVFRRTP